MTKLSFRSRFRTALLAGCLGTALAMGCGGGVTALSKGDGGGAASSGSAGTNGSGGTNGGAAHNGSAGTNGVAGAGSGNPTGTGGFGGAGGGGSITKIPLGMTQCSDGIDNDGDGLIDSADPECTGAADNDESSFATGIPGDNIDACKQDCFFDGNSGMGDDGCDWQLQCDPLSKNTRCPFSQSYVDKHATACSATASQSQHCIDFCEKFVPNGCDCFGCCAIPGAPTSIRLDPTCTVKDFADPTKCSPCTQVTQCANPCERCELCVGKDTVPADCVYTPPPPPADGGTYDGGSDAPPPPPPPPKDGGGYVQCTGHVACVPGPTAVCPAGTSCVTGCCLPIIP
jgi:hypothetical protein